MCGRLDAYITQFTQLQVDRDQTSWAGMPNHASPEKPFLLLTVIDRIASGGINSPFVELSRELSETYQKYFALLPSAEREANIFSPFIDLNNSDFWHLKPKEPTAAHSSIVTTEQFREHYFGAKLDQELFQLIKMETSRQKLQEALIQTFFLPEIQESVRILSASNCTSAQ